MNYAKRDGEIKGWRQLEGSDWIREDDIGICSFAGEVNELDETMLSHCNWVKWISGYYHFHNFEDMEPGTIAEKIAEEYISYLHRVDSVLVQELKPNRTYSIWRRKPTLQRRSWQNEPLPLP